MSIRLEELLAKVPPEVEKRVKDASDEARRSLQDAMREECRLLMRTPEESRLGKGGAQVPIEVLPGCPRCILGLVFPDDYWRILLLSQHRAELEACLSGDSGLHSLKERLLDRVESAERAALLAEHLWANMQWARDRIAEIDDADPVRRIVGVDEDVLGAYIYEVDPSSTDDKVPNKARIGLYWCVIGIVAAGLGCRVEDLTVVVLAHELAHAYTQVGADIQGRRWLASAFQSADIEVKEGLAQYLCERVLEQVQHRYPDASTAFHLLLEKQTFPYRIHKHWQGPRAPEAIRAAMLEVRRNRLGRLAEFEDRLNRASGQLG
jgi:hypothetical protein